MHGVPAVAVAEEPVHHRESTTRLAIGGVRRFQIVSLAAVLAIAVPYVWVAWDLWGGRLDPLRVNGPGVVYDVQGHALLHGHISLPSRSIGIEAFVRNGRTYTYFGMFPSLIRIPILLVTHSLDGRLTAMSIVASWLVTAAFGALLLWRVRTVMRGDAPLGWTEAIAHGVLLASLLGGSVLVFLASEPLMYSEDLAWSVALCSGSLFALLGVVEKPSWARVVFAGSLVLLTNLNRATTGYACVIGALLIAAWFALGRAGTERRRWALPTALAGLVALIAGCVVNLAKFDLLFGVPASEQLLYHVFGFGLINGGHYFGLRFLPSTVQAYLWPGNLRVTSVFPYLTLPDVPIQPIAHTTLFVRDPIASVPASMPLLFVVGLWGVIAAFRPHHSVVVRSLRILLIVSALSAGGVAIFGWVLERFVSEFMPLLLMASTVGMVDVWQRLEGGRHLVRTGALAVIGALALFGVVANMGIAVAPNGDWTRVQAHNYVKTQLDISHHTGNPLSGRVVRGNFFPTQLSIGQLFILGDCKALYVSYRDTPHGGGIYEIPAVLLPVERAPDTSLCRSLLSGVRRKP